MKLEHYTKQLCIISLLAATAALVRVGINFMALSLPTPFYGIVIKIGLIETLTFTCGFVFGPLGGFMTGVISIVVSDLFTLIGIWTPFIAIIIGIMGIFGSLLRHYKPNPSLKILGIMAIGVTLLSELLQNIWFVWYMWTFYTPGTPFSIILGITLVQGIPSLIAALIGNFILFTTVVPQIIKILEKQLMLDQN